MTKALVGLFGSDRFRLAVSADGSTFFDGLSVDNATGVVDQPRREHQLPAREVQDTGARERAVGDQDLHRYTFRVRPVRRRPLPPS